MSTRVVCAALRWKGALVVGPRHYDRTMREQIEAREDRLEPWSSAEQGFIDQYGNFLTRSEAYRVASAAGQILVRTGARNDTRARALFSKDLY